MLRRHMLMGLATLTLILMPTKIMPALGFAPSNIAVHYGPKALSFLEKVTHKDYLNKPQQIEYISPEKKYRPITTACRWGKVDSLLYLLSKGYSPDTNREHRNCLTNANMAVMEILLNSTHIGLFKTSSLESAYRIRVDRVHHTGKCTDSDFRSIKLLEVALEHFSTDSSNNTYQNLCKG